MVDNINNHKLFNSKLLNTEMFTTEVKGNKGHTLG